MRLSLEMFGNRGSRRRPNGGRQHRSAAVAERRGPAGVGEHGTLIVGPAGTWEVLLPPSMNRFGDSGENPWPAGGASCVCGSEAQGAAVPRSEGNEAAREGRQEVGVLRSTEEAGEPPRGTPWREGSTGTRERFEGKMAEIQGSTTVSTKLERIAKLAREMPHAALTTLAHHIDIDWLREAYRRTRKNGATGVDRQTADEYASNLEINLRSLLERAKSGSYVAPPVRRVHIPKGDGSQTRPIGIPTFEDKVLQRPVAMVLEAVYEQSFLDCSYGFRPGRSAHQALRLVQSQTVKMAGRWVLEVDIRKFLDPSSYCPQVHEVVRKGRVDHRSP